MPAMRIDSVELFPVQSPREQGSSHRHILVRLTSDTGHTGWGEMSDIGHPPAYDFELNSLQQVLRVILLGRDPCNLVALERDVLDRFPEEHYLYSMSALVRCGVDIALHDLVGQILSLPVATLLGGQVRDRIRVCYPIFRQTSAESIARNLQRVGEKLAQGFDLFRVYVGGQPELDLRFLQALRRVYGDRVRIKSLDFSGTLASQPRPAGTAARAGRSAAGGEPVPQTGPGWVRRVPEPLSAAGKRAYLQSQSWLRTGAVWGRGHLQHRSVLRWRAARRGASFPSRAGEREAMPDRDDPGGRRRHCGR
ncbi:MAG: hypothetical protein C4289_01445, partial [Chloroflexota bacterium]